MQAHSYLSLAQASTYNVLYADGDDDIKTSNHKTHDGFSISLGSCYGDFDCTHNTTKNVVGFNTRYEHGRQAAKDMIAKIRSGKIPCRKTIDSKGNLQIIDVLDVVTHSMGFAYGMGMIDELRHYCTIGRVYNIAPENACSGKVCAEYQEFWQYGTDENKSLTELPMSKRDGVAPQCPIGDIGDISQSIGGRIYIPVDWSPQGFIASHSVTNFGCLFTRLNSNKARGYVKKRDY